MEAAKAPAPQTTGTGSKRGHFPGRWLSFALAASLIAVASSVAFQQPLRPDPLSKPALLSREWWKYPIETNAVRRLTVINADIRDIAWVAKTNTLWITGSGGLIASSTDGGRNWQKRSIVLARPKEESVEAESRDAQKKYDPTPAPTTSATPTPVRSRSKALNLPANDFRFVSIETNLKAAADKKARGRVQPSPTPTRAESPPPQSESQLTEQRSKPAAPPAQAVPSASPSPGVSPLATPAPSLPAAESSSTSAPANQAVASASPSPSGPPAVTPPHEVYPDLHAIWFEDANYGWAAGTRGAVARTLDGGETWTLVSGADGPNLRISDLKVKFIAILFDNEGDGWFLSPEGLFFTTDDGGRHAGLVPDSPRNRSAFLQSAFLFDVNEAWGLGLDKALYRSADKGLTWTKQETQETSPIITIGSGGWIRDSEGRAAKMYMGANRPAANPVVPSKTNSVLFSDDRIAWAVGDAGSISITSDAGQTWRTLTAGLSDDIKQLLETAGRHRVFPAPWYLLSCLVALGLCLPMFRRPPSREMEKSVADMLASDRPILPGDPDPLKFQAVALGLSRFLRNRNTTPPLSIAITGEWGSGKSSLMNLLRGDLSSRGFRPVWFNPWHHQKEEHLLAALLENIQAQAIPNLFSAAGFYYRLPLLWFRARRFWRISLLLAAVLAFSVGYFAVDPGPRIQRAGEQLQQVTEVTAAYVAGLFPKHEQESRKESAEQRPSPSPPGKESAEQKPSPSPPGKESAEQKPSPSPPGKIPAEGPAALVFLTSIIGFVVAVVRGMKSFGIDPTSLLATSSAKPSLRALKAETSFRYRFARQFQDITQALRACDYRTMLILIDDLDRCRPESVVETLEAINFLVTSGECFVVIGMARERVERCVGLAFKDLAEEASNTSDEKAASAPKQGRIDFARQYLEKLINIEVPVPIATSEQSRELFAPEAHDSKPLRWWEKPFARKLARAASRALLIGLLLGGLYLSAGLFFPRPDSPSGPVDHSTKSPITTAAPADLSAAPVVTDAEGPARVDENLPPATLSPAKPGGSSRSVFWFMVALFVAIALGQMFARPPVSLDDSDKFTSALRIWHPLIAKRRNTPRSLKRFLNRLRYLAMRQGVAEPEPTPWERLQARVFGRAVAIPATVTAGENRIEEDVLVGLAACRYLYPEEDIAVAVKKGVEALKDLPPADPRVLDEWRLRQDFSASFPQRASPHAEVFENLHAGLYVY